MTTQDSRSGGIGLFAMGLTLGLSVGSIGVYVWQQREFQKFRRQAAEQLEAIQAGKEIVGDLIIPAGNKSPDSVEDRIQKLGDECVEDARRRRTNLGGALGMPLDRDDPAVRGRFERLDELADVRGGPQA